jgi:hypothetical protein
MNIANASAEVLDRSGNARHGNWTDHATTTTSGPLGQALRFDGVDDAVATPDADALDPTGDLSVAAWFRLDSCTGAQNKYLVIKENVASPFSTWQLMFAPATDQKPIFQVKNTLGTNFNAINYDWTCRPNEWHHLVGIKSGTSLNLYFDGQANSVVADTFSGTALNGDDQLTLGLDDGAFMFGGALDDVRVYSRALSAREVKRLFELGE